MPEEYYLVKEIATIVRRHPRTIRRWIAEEYIRGKRVRDGWLIPKSEKERIFAESDDYQKDSDI